MKQFFDDIKTATIGASALILIGLLLIGSLVFWGGENLNNFPYLLPILIGLVAFPAMIFTILYASRITNFIGVSSRFHAFGMPPGSIRAILATGFIVLVLIFGVFTLTISDTGSRLQTVVKIDISDGVSTNTELLKYIDKYSDKFILSANPKEISSGTGGYILIQREINNEDTIKLAQQILTMLATALTAIVGFYFGSRTANEPEQSNAVQTVDIIESLKNRVDNLNQNFVSAGGAERIIGEITILSSDTEKKRKRIGIFSDWHQRLADIKTVIVDANSTQIQIKEAEKGLDLLEKQWMKIFHLLSTESFSEFDTITANS